MEYIAQLEHIVAGWFKDLPRLPKALRVWLRDNIWWITMVFAIFAGLSALGLLTSLFSGLANLGSPFASYYTSANVVLWGAVQAAVGFFFATLSAIVLAVAVTPLKDRLKKGWNLLFAALLIDAVATVVGAVLTLNPVSLVFQIVFGAIWLAIVAYFVFEIRGEFAHLEKTKGAKKRKA